MRYSLAKIVFGAMVLSNVAACGSTGLYPAELASATEVYPPSAIAASYESAPTVSKTEATFDTAFADVWSITRRSIAQNQWIIRSESESDGVILATKTVRDQRASGDSYQPTDRNYYFLVDVSELAGSQSRIRAVARTQAQCYQIARGAAAAMTIGLSELYTRDEQKNCKDEASKVQWAEGSKSAKTDLENLIVLVNNNLIAAGL